MASNTPYLDIADAYATQARQLAQNQASQLQNQLNTSKAATAANYNASAAQAYANYAKQRNALPEQLRSQGINGGASESAMVRLANNYAQNVANNNASRNAAMAQLQNAYDMNVANLNQQAEENILNNRLALQQNQVQYEDTLAQRAAEQKRYEEEVARAIRERAEDIAREDEWRNKTWEREDAAYERDIAREDYLRQLGYDREDALYNRDIAREDALRAAEWSRADTQRAEDIARDDLRYEYEKQFNEKQYADEQKWKETEWKQSQIDKKVEQYAAGLLKYTDISTLEKMAKKLTKKKGWNKDPYTYGRVQAIRNRIGVIKAEKKK